MKILKYVDRINLLNKLLKEGRTGNPDILAKRLGISKARLHQLVEELRIMQIPIAYSRSLETYYYTSDYEMAAKITFRPLSDTDLSLTKGGCKEDSDNFFDLV